MVGIFYGYFSITNIFHLIEIERIRSKDRVFDYFIHQKTLIVIISKHKAIDDKSLSK